VFSPRWLTEVMAVFLKNRRLGELTVNSNCIIDEKEPLGHVSFSSWMEFKKRHSGWSPRKLWRHYYRDWAAF